MLYTFSNGRHDDSGADGDSWRGWSMPTNYCSQDNSRGDSEGDGEEEG